MDLTISQIRRGALVGAFLDITLDQWHEGVAKLDMAEPIDPSIERSLVTAIESLQNVGNEDSRGNYLQAMVTLSDDGLAWVVEKFGTMPQNLPEVK